MGVQRPDKTVPTKVLAVDVPSLTRPNDRRRLFVAFCGALVIHTLAMLLSFPEARREPSPARQHTPIVVKRYVPPPPEIQPRQVAISKKNYTRKIPIPDPTPAAPEPIREPAPELALGPVLGDVELLIGEPSPPRPPGPYGPPGTGEPLLAGVGGATLPVRIEESYVQPEYPEIARVARIESNVILQAVIHCDGTVGETKTLRSDRPGFGFEDAAIAAVTQWRYEPARQNGRPVCVYFTILVEFSLV